METGLIRQHWMVIIRVEDTRELVVFRLWFDSVSDSSGASENTRTRTHTDTDTQHPYSYDTRAIQVLAI